MRDVKEMIQEVVNLAQRVYKDPAPGGFGRTLRREKAGQEKLKQRILSVSAHKSVLTEKQVLISFPNDRQPSVVAKMFWKEDADEEDASSKPLYPKGVK